MNHTEEYPDVTHSTSLNAYLAYQAWLSSFWAAVRRSPHYQAVPVLYKVWSPCLLLLGGFGNVATIFVQRRIMDSNSSQHVFLIALAVADLSFLFFSVLPYSVYYYFMVNVWTLHTVTCKLFKWLPAVSSTLSAWLVTAVTVQRTLAVTWPHKVRMMCTVRRTWTVVATLVITGCVLQTEFMVMFRLQNNECSYYKTRSYLFFLTYISTWLGLSLNSFMPFTCLLVCDVILSLSLFQATSARYVANQAISNAPSVHSDNSRRETARRTTVMILALSISFLVLTLPARVVVMWLNLSIKQINVNPKMYLIYYAMSNVSHLLLQTNSAINFFLYCFTGTRFRREFLNWIRCGVTDHSSRSVGKTAGGSSRGERNKRHDSAQKSRLTRT